MRSLLLAILLVFLTTEGMADIPSQEAEAETSSEIVPAEGYLESTRQTVSSRVFRLADQVDSLFGDKRADDKRNTSTLRVTQGYSVKDGAGSLGDISATLNLYLPNVRRLEERIREYLTPKESFEEGAEGQSNISEKSYWSFSQEAGIVGGVPLNYFARGRVRRDFIVGDFVHAFYEQVGWSQRSEWEEKTSFYSDYAVNRALLFRFVNEKDWAMTNRTVGSSHGPSLLQQLSDISAISYDARFNTILESNGFIQNRISIGSLYRTKLPIGWMYLDVNPEIAWERATRYRPLYNFYVRLELVFGENL